MDNEPGRGKMPEQQEGSQKDGRPRILIIKRSSLGDIVHTLPVANALRDRYPEAYLAWLVETRFANILAGHPALDDVIAIERYDLTQPVRLIRESLRVRRELLARDFEWAIDLQGLLKSGHLLGWSGAERRIGLDEPRREFNYFSHHMCTELVPGDITAHAVTRYLHVAEHLGCDVSNPRFDLHVSAEDEEWARETFAEAGLGGSAPIVGINPGASNVHKQWPPERFVAVTKLLPDMQWVVLGGPAEVELAQSIADGIDGPVLVTAGRTNLQQLMAVISSLDALVTADTGPMHIAAALGVPTVALFGPTDPRRTRPFGDIHTVIVHEQDCSFCKNKPTCRDYHCMTAITPAEVAAAVRAALR